MDEFTQNIASHLSMTRELVEFLWQRGLWWLIPVMVLWAFLPLTIVLVLIGIYLVWSRTQLNIDNTI